MKIASEVKIDNKDKNIEVTYTDGSVGFFCFDVFDVKGKSCCYNNNIKEEFEVLIDHFNETMKQDFDVKQMIVLIEHYYDIGNGLIQHLKEKVGVTETDYMG
jgi:hypothetical protein